MLHDPAAHSDHVCYPCVPKIRSLGQLFEFVKAGTTPTLNCVPKSTKRTLATPGIGSPSRRKSQFFELIRCKMGLTSLHDLLQFMTFVRLPFSVRSLDLFCRFTRVYEGHFMLCYKKEF